MRAKNLDITLVSAVTALILFANGFIAQKAVPFFPRANKGFTTESVLVATRWVSSAPIVLAQNFKTVELTNVGEAKVNGFGFSDQIQQVWHGGTVDFTEVPIDLTSNAASKKLIDLSKYESNTYCPSQLFCGLNVIWDDQADHDKSKFVGVQFAKTSYGLVESKLLERFLSENK